MSGSKADPISDILDSISEQLAVVTGQGTSRSDALKNKTCAWCEADCSEEGSFRDAKSRKEYAISALCQKCQDNFFE
jgi:hypothetical protein